MRTDLTEREIAVLKLYATARSVKMIAGELAVCRQTVDKHLEHIRLKTGARDRVTLTHWAIGRGLVELMRFG